MVKTFISFEVTISRSKALRVVIIGGAVLVIVTVEVGSTFKHEQALERPASIEALSLPVGTPAETATPLIAAVTIAAMMLTNAARLTLRGVGDGLSARFCSSRVDTAVFVTVETVVVRTVLKTVDMSVAVTVVTVNVCV